MASVGLTEPPRCRAASGTRKVDEQEVRNVVEWNVWSWQGWRAWCVRWDDWFRGLTRVSSITFGALPHALTVGAARVSLSISRTMCNFLP